jgi:elongation factor Ts
MAQVKELRERTGAGIVNCKKALTENDGDIEKAIDFLREKGLAAAAKKAGRAAEQGVVGSYIHGGGKIGVLVEINCETDFVARTEEFQQLVKDVAMQVAAASPRCVRREEVSEAERDRERGVYRVQAEESGKPANIIEKIIAGKLEKFYSETCLLEQTFIRDSSKTVEQIVQDTMTRTGENIVVHRFARFRIGEAGTVDEANE